MNDAETPIGVYVHWPYCARICPYCDFNVYKNKEIDAALWGRILLADLDFWTDQIPKRPLQSLYFGGGTPSLAPMPVIEKVIDRCARLWGFAPDAEITIEANPTDAEQSRFAEFSAAGINRLSLGVQSLRDESLRFLGRDHNSENARRAIDMAASIFPSFSFDLIYGLPGQSLNDWRSELKDALSIAPPHLSLYQLTIEPGTAFDRAVSRDQWRPAVEDMAAAMFETAQALCAAAGLPAYEISNHAAREHASRHNHLYWRYNDYIGIGPGAHGRLTVYGERLATEAVKSPEAYVNADPEDRFACNRLTDEEATIERLSLGLRLKEGVAFGEADPYLQKEGAKERLAALESDGLLTRSRTRLMATDTGRRLLNHVLYKLFA